MLRCAKCQCEMRNTTYGSVCEDCWVDNRSYFGSPLGSSPLTKWGDRVKTEGELKKEWDEMKDDEVGSDGSILRMKKSG